ncbi:hypothetical protein PTKIN_Ptkin15bG0066900 [Pterospermum kingtungense]
MACWETANHKDFQQRGHDRNPEGDMETQQRSRNNGAGGEFFFFSNSRNAFFWIRIYELPLGLRNQATGMRIGQQLGRIITMDDTLESEGWANFIRLGVEIDITKPLKKGIKLSQGPGRREVWARRSYERLPTFCYDCGLLGHTETECTSPMCKEEDGKATHQYKDWLRSSPLKKGVTFNKKNSTSAKTEEFFTQLRANSWEQIKVSKENKAVTGGPVRQLQMEVPNHTNPNTISQNDDMVPEESHDEYLQKEK